MKTLISFSMLTLLMAASCRKNKTTEQLPPETHEGKFTFGCKVDGKIYTAEGKGGLLAFDHMYYSFPPEDSLIYIGANSIDDTKRKFNIELSIKYSGKPGIFPMTIYPCEGIFSDNSKGTLPTGSNTFKTTQNYNGSVHVKYFNGQITPHSIGTIISGTFEMDAINEEGNVVHITDGRFDIGH